MNRSLASLGSVLVLAAVLLFWSTFSGGSLWGLVITDGNTVANFVAMAFVVVFLPLGSGMAFYGFTSKGNLAAEPQAGRGAYGGGGGSTGKAALAVAVIALVVGAGVYMGMSSSVSDQANQISSLSSELAALQGKPPAASINAPPGVIAYRVDWTNTDPTGQDRFFPNVIVVPQGDIVQVLFEHNDTDAHTFTIYATQTPYGFQINATITGMRDFLDSHLYSKSCMNGTYAQDTSVLTANGVSTVYCVSGSSLLSASFLASHAASNFRIAVNPNPAEPLTPDNKSGNPTTELLPVNDVVVYKGGTLQAIGGNVNFTAEVFGIGAFQATTPGVFEFFCDYHVSNGMFGYLVVVPNAYCTTNPTACGVTNSTSTA